MLTWVPPCASSRAEPLLAQPRGPCTGLPTSQALHWGRGRGRVGPGLSCGAVSGPDLPQAGAPVLSPVLSPPAWLCRDAHSGPASWDLTAQGQSREGGFQNREFKT